MAELPKSPGFRIDGRRALVTGGSAGLGLACAAALAGQGAHVVVAARHRETLDDAVALLRDAGGSAEGLVIDVTDRAAVEAALAQQAPLDILVNNAGTNRPGPFIEATDDDFQTVFDLNVRAAFHVAQCVVRRMLSDRRAGSIINMSSQMGHVGAANRTLYCASKHAIEGLTKAMAVELAPSNIRVNSICPTFIETPLTEPYFRDAAFRTAVLSKIKLGRLGRLEDVMGAVIYLASDASALVTGSALKVDGGWTAG
ncbi:MAG TPA: SDR family NAD(P)-dependent oxidoreductase [Devosia sp.]|nr:SDR family NAD(P)-dependent oxidoreductase [Devosia sp.]